MNEQDEMNIASMIKGEQLQQILEAALLVACRDTAQGGDVLGFLISRGDRHGIDQCAFEK